MACRIERLGVNQLIITSIKVSKDISSTGPCVQYCQIDTVLINTCMQKFVSHNYTNHPTELERSTVYKYILIILMQLVFT